MTKVVEWLRQRPPNVPRWMTMLSLVASVWVTHKREQRFKQIETDIRVLQSREVARSQRHAARAGVR